MEPEMDFSVIHEAAHMFATDREAFNIKYAGTVHGLYLTMLFTSAATRPELAEIIPVLLMGYDLNPEKHGLDGFPSETQAGYAEVKVTTTDTIRKAKGNLGTITINDPSQNIIDKYNEKKPEFLFPLFIDGHLISIMSVPWTTLRETYVEEIRKIQEKNLKKKVGSSASRSFSLSPTKWMKNAEVVFVHQNIALITELMTAVKVPKMYKAKVLNSHQTKVLESVAEFA